MAQWLELLLFFVGAFIIFVCPWFAINGYEQHKITKKKKANETTLELFPQAKDTYNCYNKAVADFCELHGQQNEITKKFDELQNQLLYAPKFAIAEIDTELEQVKTELYELNIKIEYVNSIINQCKKDLNMYAKECGQEEFYFRID